jgi:hypothetical protein
MINKKPTVDELHELWNRVVGYVEKNNVSCEEHIGQCDRAQVDAIDLAIDASAIVGYVDVDE